jgi:hypothetical protein
MKIYVKKKRTSLYTWLVKKNKYHYHVYFEGNSTVKDYKEYFVDYFALQKRLWDEPLWRGHMFPHDFVCWWEWANEGFAIYYKDYKEEYNYAVGKDRKS